MAITNTQEHDYLDIISTRGWLLLHDQTQDDFDRLTSFLGERLYDSDIKVDLSVPNKVAQPDAIPFHCDSPRAKFIGWRCIAEDQIPTPLFLKDAHEAILNLSSMARHALTSTRAAFNCRISEKLCTMPLVSTDRKSGALVAFLNPWGLPKNMNGERTGAVNEFLSALDRVMPIVITFKASDVLIIDNQRMFHGRPPVPLREGVSSRHLLRRLVASSSVSPSIEAATSAA